MIRLLSALSLLGRVHAAGRARRRPLVARRRALPSAPPADRHRRQQPDVREERRGRAPGVRGLPGPGDEARRWTTRRSTTGRRSRRRSPASRSCSCATAACCRSTIRRSSTCRSCAQVHNPFGDISQVTIRHLMSHSAGFRAGDVAVGRRPAVAPVRADALGAARRDAAVHRAAVPRRARSTATRTRASSSSAASSSCCPATTTRSTSTRTSSCRSA